MRFSWWEQLTQDIRFSLRNLAGTPSFAASAIISLALGIGATTAIFSVIDGVILDPFPYAHPETLYSVLATFLIATSISCRTLLTISSS